MKKQKEKNKKEAEKKKEGNAEGVEGKIEDDSTLHEGDLQKASGLSSYEPIKPTANEGSLGGTAQENEDEGVSTPSNGEVEMRAQPPHGRQPSLSLQSRMRSTSFRNTANSQAPLSPTTNGSNSIPTLPPLSPGGDAVEVYRKQAIRLDELEKDNRRLSKELLGAQARWKDSEDRLDELREASSEVAEHKSRAEQAIAQSEEILKLVYQPNYSTRHYYALMSVCRKTIIPLFNARSLNCSLRRSSPPVVSPHLDNPIPLVTHQDS